MTTPIHQISEAFDQVLNTIVYQQDDEHLMAAAKSRLLELRTLVLAVSGEGEPHDPRVRPLSRAVNDYIEKLDVDNRKPAGIDDIEDEGQVEQMLLEREEVETLLNQARIAALCMLANINAAVKSLNSRTKV